MANTKKYLKGLHALRFFAASLVVIFHCNDALRQVDVSLMSKSNIFFKGPQAVDFFFVLSGYLLTYLACHEYHKYGRLDIVAFFKRRVLRIFPLYYLAVFLGLFLIGYLYPKFYGETFLSFTMAEGLPYYLFFMPNYVIVTWENIGPLYMLWSIGVEEQFYLFFPFLMMAAFYIVKPIRILVFVFVLYLLFYLSVAFGLIHFPDPFDVFIVKTLRFHFLLWGCVLGASLYYHPDALAKLWDNRGVQLVAWIAFIASLFILNKSSDPYNMLGGFLFSIVMVMVSRSTSIFNLEIKPFIYLGIISYGIYIFHPFVSIGLRFIMERIPFLHAALTGFTPLFYLATFLLTIAIAHISYRYYESIFLNLKRKFEK